MDLPGKTLDRLECGFKFKLIYTLHFVTLNNYVLLKLNFEPFPELTAERIVLRRISHKDKDDIFFLRSDENVLKYLDKVPSPSVDETLEYIDKINTLINDNESILWGICLKKHTKLIGTICYWRMVKEHFRAEIGYVLHPQYQGTGIMHEAIGEVLRYGFETMQLHSVEAKVNPENVASIKLLEKNGFVREGYFREDFFFNGKFLDTGVYSLLTPLND